MSLRLRIVSLFFLLAFAALISRLFFWQILRGKELATSAQNQYQLDESIPAPRGAILASDGSWLAAGSEAWLVYASRPDIESNERTIADQLAPLFVEDSDDHPTVLAEVERVYSLLTREGAVWVPLRHKVSSEIKSNIEAMDIAGIGFELQEARFYPEASVGAHLLGFVGKDEEGEDVGYFGLEGYYNLSLSGRQGLLSFEKDARGQPILIGDASEVTAVKGVDLLTHIDRGLQLMLEEKLLEGIQRYGAKAGSAIIMDPINGAVLAMSSFPSYDPEEYFEYTNELFKNPIVSSSFEPGSVFKVLVMAAALDDGAVETDTKCDICGGPVKVDKYTIETWNREYNEDATMLDVIVHSDNVGMVYTAQKLGADRLYDYLSNFGIGNVTNIDVQGESSPRIREKGTWSVVDLATTAFGQGIATTPLQIIRAVAAIANKGVLVTPQIVDKLVGDGWEEDILPQIGSRVISEDTARDVTSMMVEAASSGEAQWTHLRGFSVAGKTGTAQIPIAGHYDEEKTIASFVGFAPAINPKFIMLVTLRETQSSPWASETAAPLWYSVARELFRHFGIQPNS